MFVSAPFTANLADVPIEDHRLRAVADTLGRQSYDADQSRGFDIQKVESDRLSAHLLRSETVDVQQYDEASGELTDAAVETVAQIPFRLDFDRGLLEVFSNGRDASHLLDALEDAVELQSAPRHAELNLAAVYQTLQEGEFDVSVTGLQVRNVAVDEHTSGNYRLSVADDAQAASYVTEYAGDIAYLGTTVAGPDGSVSMGFYDSGSIRAFSTDAASVWESIKNRVADGSGMALD
jgi:hypothetical protein